MKENISVHVLDESSNEDLLQGVIDLYKKHEELDKKQKEERGIDTVENLKKRISEGIDFIIAKNSDGKIVGTRMAKRSEKEDFSLFWVYSLFVDPNERKKGIGKKIENFYAKKLQALSEKTKKRVFEACGIETNNETSLKFHKELGYEIGETFSGDGSDAGHEYYHAFKGFFPEEE